MPAFSTIAYCVSNWLSASTCLLLSIAAVCAPSPATTMLTSVSGFIPAVEIRAFATGTPPEPIEMTPMLFPLRSVFLDGTFSRHSDTVDIPLVRGIKNFRFDSLGPSGRKRLHAWQRERNLRCGGGLDAVRRAGQCHQFHLNTVFLIPAHLGGARKGRGARRECLR